MQENVYLKITLSAKVHKPQVTVGDVAKVYCQDKALLNKIKTLNIYTFHNPKENRVIYSAVKVIEIITENCPSINISHIGEPDFVLEYEPINKKNIIPAWVNVSICSIIMFFGAAFAIMTFNTDVSISKLFSDIYADITGQNNNGFSILEISYSVGLGLGIIIFYNHFGKRRLSKDPTPIELEMRSYETDIETALVDGVNKKGEHIDVG
ncbi:MAG: stage V sporulation protein AA [Lachnospiraceae bacterium]|nr:stage V sporulation protein AA [Lachnospiraceae bacterium]